jgi:hypothetical protein
MQNNTWDRTVRMGGRGPPPWQNLLSSTSRMGSLHRTDFQFLIMQKGEREIERGRTDDVSEALAAVLAALEAEEAFQGAEEAVL